MTSGFGDKNDILVARMPQDEQDNESQARAKNGVGRGEKHHLNIKSAVTQSQGITGPWIGSSDSKGAFVGGRAQKKAEQLRVSFR